jgi:hypothetical protein
VDGVSPTTFGFLDATSSIQTQLNALAPSISPTFSGTPTTPTPSGCTANLDIANMAAIAACASGGGGSSVGTAGQMQIAGSTAGSFAAGAITDNLSVLTASEQLNMAAGQGINLQPTQNATSVANFTSGPFDLQYSYWSSGAPVGDAVASFLNVSSGATPTVYYTISGGTTQSPSHAFGLEVEQAPSLLATSSQNVPPAVLLLGGSIWTGSVATPETISFITTLGTGANPAVTVSEACAGSSGACNFSFGGLLTVTAGAAGITNGGAHWTGGTSLPGTCAVGDIYNLTNATSAAASFQTCYPANTWNEAGGGLLIGTPTKTADAGAGTSPTIAFETGYNDQRGWISVTTGSTPSASAGIVTISFGGTYSTAPLCSVVPANPAAATIFGTAAPYVPFSTSSTSNFVIQAGSTALTASTAYIFYYSCQL